MEVESLDFLSNLSHEMLMHICSFLEPKDVCCLGRCSKFLKSFVACNDIWLPLVQKRFSLCEMDEEVDGLTLFKRFSSFSSKFRSGKSKVCY